METEAIFTNGMHDKRYWKMDRETGSTLSFKDGFFVLELHGTPYERGFAHGKLLHDEIQKSNIVAYYGDFLKSLFNNSDLAKKMPKGARKPIGDILEQWYYSPLEKMCLPETRDEIYGICEAVWPGDEEKKKQSLRGTFAPDIMEHLAAAHLRGTKESLGNYYLGGGCSAAYAKGKALRNNSFALFARNLDFPGVFVWKNPTVIFSYPTENLNVLKNSKMKEINEVKQPYVYVSTAGFPGIGLTGLNASGLSMATFVCLSKNCSTKGMSMLDFNHYLFTRAKSIEDVASMIENPRLESMSPHAVMFADGKDAISLEVDSKNKEIRYSQSNLHVQTNHFITPELKKKEFMFPLEKDFTEGRYILIQKALVENYNYLDLQKMIDIISCNLNQKEGKTAMIGDFPAQPNTLTSVVFKLYGKAGTDSFSPRNELWIATGKPPAVCYNPYSKFGFKEDFSWDKRAWGFVSRSSKPVLEDTLSFTPMTPKMKQSLVHFSLSQEEHKMGKFKFARENLDRAIECYDDPGYRRIRGIINMQMGDINEAYQEFVPLKANHSFSPAKDSYLSLLIGNCLDILGRRDEALACYEKILHKNRSKQFEKAASRSIRKPFSLAKMPSSIDYHFGGPLEL